MKAPEALTPAKTELVRCKICGSNTHPRGAKWGKWAKRPFSLRSCPTCGFSFVSDPCTDYAALYSPSYYSGNGPDPLIHYDFELDNPERTIRVYEWRGILKVVKSLVPVQHDTRWLDFGCGNGGLVRYCRQIEHCQIVGFEEGAIVSKAIEFGIPIISRAELERMESVFDIVTAIEVFEHVEDPLAVFSSIHRLLKPGGLLFYTTGNARAHRRNLAAWSYVLPEVHISFYEPATLDRALRLAGFKTEFRGYLPGFSEIMRFKILKNLRVYRRSFLERTLPWELIARITDLCFEVSAHPIGWAS